MSSVSSPGEFDDLIIHVGYHKTGSTLLQQRLFVAEHGFHSPWSQSFYHRHILLDRPDRGWPSRIRRAFRDEIDRGRERGLTPVLTCEALSGDIWRRGQSNGYGNFEVATALAEAFPGARTLLVHREQASMICSLYKHSVRSHWRFSVESFLDQEPLRAGMAPLLNFGYLEYSWLSEHYLGLVGADRFAAVPYELLGSPDAWCSRLSTITGRRVPPEWFAQSENTGMSALIALPKRRANFLMPGTADPNASRSGRLVNNVAAKIDHLVPDEWRARSEAHLRERVADLVGDRFAEDNARLFQIVGEDWSPLGYPSARAVGEEPESAST
jgi:hypothetical protein